MTLPIPFTRKGFLYLVCLFQILIFGGYSWIISCADLRLQTKTDVSSIFTLFLHNSLHVYDVLNTIENQKGSKWHPALFWDWNFTLFFSGTSESYVGAITKIKLLKLKGPHCWSHLLFIFVHTFLYPRRQTGQTKAQEMGGTDQDGHRALGLNGTLTQTNT